MARSGLATVEALVASGAEVVAWDERAEARAAALALDPGLRRGTLELGNPLEIDLAGFDGVVVSPGVPLNTHPIAAKAREAGVPVIGDIELFAQARADLPPHKVVGITGTNGKSTTTALVHHILKTAGVPTEMGGNIGLPILAQEPLPEGGVYVLELSSYQIDLTYSLDCDVAVLLNVTPDHLDRYESFETYAASKFRLFEMQGSLKLAVFGGPTATERAWSERAGKLHQSFASDYLDYYVDDEAAWLSLQGPHNLENVGCAVAAAEWLGVDVDMIKQALRTYPGLPHRMERVAERGGILFVNDSKATNPDSTAPALAAYPHVHWIVGGRAKTEDLGPCADQLDHVRAAYTIGEAGPMFARLLEDRVPVTQSGVLETAVRDAAGAAVAGEVVLLSPACASFDQFRDYEQRGQAFRDAVEALT
ncbi:MAG TPA: UDP-N-acetylmuramoyl-L-alanine--D-glutamate ligase [Allosphingosinicella sp.]|nr:UDP-N-acetylmuramoyl-L-alanine--D-glutamate ligase [Allosphingosinicella sp.]